MFWPPLGQRNGTPSPQFASGPPARAGAVTRAAPPIDERNSLKVVHRFSPSCAGDDRAHARREIGIRERALGDVRSQAGVVHAVGRRLTRNRRVDFEQALRETDRARERDAALGGEEQQVVLPAFEARHVAEDREMADALPLRSALMPPIISTSAYVMSLNVANSPLKVSVTRIR